MTSGNPFRQQVMGGQTAGSGPEGPPAPPPMLDGDLRVGAVVGQTFRVLLRNFVPFMLVALLLTWPSELASYLMVGDAAAGALPTAGSIVAGLVVVLLSMLLGYLVAAALIYATVQTLRGRRVGMGECLSRGLPRILPVLGVAVVSSILIGLGMLLLVVPGIILAVMLVVVVPVAVIERAGVFESLARSAGLTKGYRWKILGILLILIVIMMAIGFVIGFAGGILIFVTAGSAIVTHTVNLLIGAVSSAFGAVLIAVLYQHLRVAKEGIGIDDIAAVFD